MYKRKLNRPVFFAIEVLISALVTFILVKKCVLLPAAWLLKMSKLENKSAEFVGFLETL